MLFYNPYYSVNKTYINHMINWCKMDNWNNYNINYEYISQNSIINPNNDDCILIYDIFVKLSIDYYDK